MLKVSASSSRELQATILAIRAASRDLKKEMRADVKREVGGMWLPELRARARTRQDHQVIVRGANVASRADGFRLTAAKSGRFLSGGLVPNIEWYAVEFGARNRRGTVTRHTRKSGKVTYQAILNRGLPGRVNSHLGGRIAFDSASKIGTRAVAVWVRTIVDSYRDAAGDTRG